MSRGNYPSHGNHLSYRNHVSHGNRLAHASYVPHGNLRLPTYRGGAPRSAGATNGVAAVA